MTEYPDAIIRRLRDRLMPMHADAPLGGKQGVEEVRRCPPEPLAAGGAGGAGRYPMSTTKAEFSTTARATATISPAMNRSGFLALAMIALFFAGQAEARPDFMLTLRESGSIFAGLRYRTVSAQWAFPSTEYSVGQSETDGAPFVSWPLVNHYGFSVIKSFQQDGYETGIEGLLGLVELKHLALNTAFGYHIAKEFGRVQLMMGPYLGIDYSAKGHGPDEKNVTTVRGFISMGVRIRI